MCRHYEPLKQPLSDKQMHEMSTKNGGYVNGIIEVEIAEILNACGDRAGEPVDGFYDMLSEKLTGSTALGEIDYDIIGCVPKSNAIIMRVSGSVTGWTFDDEDEEGV